MNTIQISGEKITLELTKDELGVLTNALNEVCNGIEVWEFDTRMGINRRGQTLKLEILETNLTANSRSEYSRFKR